MTVDDFCGRVEYIRRAFDEFAPVWDQRIPRRSFVRVTLGRLTVRQLELAEALCSELKAGRHRTSYALFRAMYENFIATIAIAFVIDTSQPRGVMSKRFFYFSALERHAMQIRLRASHGHIFPPALRRSIAIDARRARKHFPASRRFRHWHQYSTFAELEAKVVAAIGTGAIPARLIPRGVSFLAVMKDYAWHFASNFVHPTWTGVERFDGSLSANPPVLGFEHQEGASRFTWSLLFPIISLAILARELGQLKAFESYLQRTSPYQSW